MNRFFLFSMMCGCFIVNGIAQSVKHDSALIKTINLMFKEDQFWRIEYLKANKNEKSKYDERTIEKKWKTTDSINMIKAKQIVNKYGYPGYTLLGEASDSFWAIIQHCDNDMPFQKHVLVLMKQQVDKNNASKEKYAYLVDRVLVNQNKKQIYGTQLSRDPKTGKFSPFPLKDPKMVDKLRKEMALEPIEEYIRDFGR